MAMRTLLTHMYNEEYLLPWWLEHHKKYFDMGILIDYQSTDRSVEICKDICPHWKVFNSANTYFEAVSCDQELMHYERQIEGWRIVLTVTEFLLGDLDTLFAEKEGRAQWIIPGIKFTKWDPEGSLDTSIPLWNQVTTGVHYRTDPNIHRCRSLHNFKDIQYTPGRHYSPYNTEIACIFQYANTIVGKPMLDRRLQIQHKMPLEVRASGAGYNHYFDVNGMDANRLKELYNSIIGSNESDCSETIELMKSKL